MATDLEPRERFVGPLRDWFVDELRRPYDRSPHSRRMPPGRDDATGDVDLVDVDLGDVDPVEEVDACGDGDFEETGGRRPRRWIVLANAAAVAAVLVGLLLVVSSRTGPSEPSQDDPTQATAWTPSASSDVVGDVCAAYAADAIQLPLGAPPAEVAAAAGDLGRRLQTARDALAGVPATPGAEPSGAEVSEAELSAALRLLDDAIESAEQLRSVAAGGADRATIDRSVENVDLIVIAASGQLEAASGRACAGLPTLRELQ